MLKSGQKNNYQKFLKKKRCFAEKVKQGKKFKDTDHDGLCDYEEKNIYGTNPLKSDTDGDGMADGLEVKRGRNPLGPGKFKNLFIPHAGNNYSPHALKPKRLLFHAISIVFIKAVVVVFILFYPLSAWLSPDLALAEAKKIIELTNNLRQKVSLPALLENRQLRQAAWQKVQDMGLNQYFAHVSPSGLGLRNWLEKVGYKYAAAGENLAVGFSGAEDVVEAWKNSPTHYNNIIDGDFKEIGVVLADGKLNQIDTVFIAQYFGAPAQVKRSVEGVFDNKVIELASPPAKAATVNSQAPKTAVKSQRIVSEEAPLVVKMAENEIIIDQSATTLTIKSDQFNKEKAIQIATALPPDTISAEVLINNQKINLHKEPGQAARWNGAALISQDEEKSILNPLIPANLAVTNSAGAVSYGEIDWDEIKIIKITPFEHYQLYKNRPAAAMAPIMNLSNLYFKFLLILSLIAILFNIFIEIRKQHPHIIFYSLAFFGLLVAMIIF